MLKNGLLQKGTYYEDNIAYIFAGIKKDEEAYAMYFFNYDGGVEICAI